jgi:hypothetical protein
VERPDDLGMEYSLFFVSDPVSDEKSKNRLSGFRYPRAKLMPKLFISLTYLSPRTMVTGCMFVAFSMKTTSIEVYKNRDGRWIKEFASDVFGCL